MSFINSKVREVRRLASLSSKSQLLFSEIEGGQFECHGCLLSSTERLIHTTLPNVEVALDHLENHRKAYHDGADHVIFLLTCCATCQGKKLVKVKDPNDHHKIVEATCQGCSGDGLNDVGRKRGVTI